MQLGRKNLRKSKKLCTKFRLQHNLQNHSMQSPLLQICAASLIGGSFEPSWKSIKFWKCATAARNQLAQNPWRHQNATTCVRRYYWNICSESLSYNNLKSLTKNLCLFMVRTQTLQKVCVSHCEIWSVCQKIKLVNLLISPRPDFSKNLRLDNVCHCVKW